MNLVLNAVAADRLRCFGARPGAQSEEQGLPACRYELPEEKWRRCATRPDHAGGHDASKTGVI